MFLLAVAHIGAVSCMLLMFLSNSDPGGDVVC